MPELKPMEYENNYADLLPKEAFRISPSMVSKFNDKKWEWYQSEILGKQTFEGNTSTVLGSIVHRIAESYTKLKKVDQEELIAYANKYRNMPDVDVDYILEQYRPMGQVLIDHLRVHGIPEEAEKRVVYELAPNVYVAGTLDAIIGDTLVDYKTTSYLNPPTDIPYYYKWQLLTYAFVCRKLGMEINRIRILWITNNVVGRVSEKTGKPMKDYPALVSQVTQIITDEDMRFIEEYLKLIAETYLQHLKTPELDYILYSDYRLKSNK